METFLRLELDVICLLAVAIVAYGERGRRVGQATTGARLFDWMVAATAIMLLLDALCWLAHGLPGGPGRGLLVAANTGYFLCHLLPVVLFIMYADFQLFGEDARIAKMRPFLLAAFAVGALSALATPFTGFLFSVDAAGRYLRGPGFLWFGAYAFALCMAALVHVVANRRRVSRKVFFSLIAYPVPVLAAAALQVLFYGLDIVWPVLTLFFLLSSFNIQRAQASTDHLTGTANRRSLDQDLEERMGGARRGRPFGAMVVDLDDFKSINDRLGHGMGDRALEDAAALLRRVVRTDDLVARYGGDEFVVVLGLGDAARLDEVVARLRREVGIFNEGGGRPYRLSFSIGAGLFDAGTDRDGRSFLSRIDALMYADKAAGCARRPSDPGAG